LRLLPPISPLPRLAALQRAFFVLSALCSLACAPPASKPAPAPAPKTPDSEVSVKPLPPRYLAGQFAYDIESTGIVTSPRDPKASVDTVHTKISVGYSATYTAGRLLTRGGVRYFVTTISVKPPPAAKPATAQTSNPTAVASATAGPTQKSFGDSIAFQMMVDTATGTVRAPGDSVAVPECPVGGPAFEQARSLATDRPASFAPGAFWSDTLSRFTCLGGIPLSSRIIRSFSVANSVVPDPTNGRPAIHVTLESTPKLDGEARRKADLISLHGVGSGTTHFYFDRQTGALLSAQNGTELDLDFSVNGRVEHLHQSASWRTHSRE